MPKEFLLGTVLLLWHDPHGPQLAADAQGCFSVCDSALCFHPGLCPSGMPAPALRFVSLLPGFLYSVSLGSTQMHAIVFQPTLKTFYLQLIPRKRPKTLVWFDGFFSLGILLKSQVVSDLGSRCPYLNYPVRQSSLFSLNVWRKGD